MLGTKKQTMPNILRMEPIKAHSKTTHVALIPKNPFCILMVFKCSITHVFRLQTVERMRAVVAFM